MKRETGSRLLDRLRESKDWEKGVLSITLPASAGRMAIKFLCSGRERQRGNRYALHQGYSCFPRQKVLSCLRVGEGLTFHRLFYT